MHNLIMPYVLFFLSLLDLVLVWRGRAAIVAGNWIRHRNFMVAALAIWATILGLFGWFLWSTNLWKLFATQVLFITYVALVLASSLMLALALWRVAKHQLLPHKLIARQTFTLWQLASLAGLVLYFMLNFSFIM